MSRPVNLFVLLELLLYLFVGFPLRLLLIALVFGLTIAQTAHLPQNPLIGPGWGERGRVAGWFGGEGRGEEGGKEGGC